MKSPQQIMKIEQLWGTCETYNCLKKISYAIGRPDAPRQLWSYFCADCIRDIVASAPKELLPVVENTEVEEEDEPAKIYTCKHCEETFTETWQLANHVRNCKMKGD